MRSYGVPFRLPSSPRSGAGSQWSRLLTLVAAIALGGTVSDPAGAEIPEFDWGPTFNLDSGVQDVGDAGGRIAEYDFLGDGLWRLVYVEGDDIRLVAGNGSGWAAPITISSDPAVSRAPSITSTGLRLHVVWEDERSGHAEIWTRRYDGTSWSTAECLSCDPLPSRKPALDGSDAASYAYVAWETESAEGDRFIEGCPFDDAVGEWGAVEPISQSPGNATDPAIGVSDGFDEVGAVVVWVDDRHGETEIYSRNRDYYHGPNWTDELRVTDLSGNCARPRVAVDICCSDTPELAGFVVFENDGGAVVESWAVAYEWWMEWSPAFRLSLDDGHASTLPSVAGVKYRPSSCYDGDANLSFVSWMDDLPGGVEQQFARYTTYQSEDVDDPMSVGAVSASGMAARTRSPDAPVLQTWLGDDNELFARQGIEFNCRVDVTEFGPYFYVAPEGGDNLVEVRDSCRDEPVADGWMRMEFYNGMESRFAIDPLQDLRPQTVTNAEGVANFVFRGGGCVTDERAGNGVIAVWCSYFLEPIAWYVQIKSPDIDGTCSVDDWDLQYVEERLGTDDFCADLDGSGLVDEFDVAMVLATLGDECERTTDAPEGGGDEPDGSLDMDLSALQKLRVLPNPGSDRFELRVPLQAGDRATLRIVDVVGRVVRELGTVEADRDGVVPLYWDGRNTAGRPVAGGVYYAALFRESVGVAERTTIIVTR